MTHPLDALESSVAYLRTLIEGLDESQYVASAHPSEWTVADTMSHLGSGAVIMKRRFDDIVAGNETPPEFNQSVWDLWNAKTPHAQVTDALIADQALLERILEMTPEEREDFSFNLGPLVLDFTGTVGLRLNEHVLHVWDIEEAFNKAATLQRDAVPFLVDNVELVIKFAGKTNGSGDVLRIRTTEPQRELVLTLGEEAVTLEDGEKSDDPHDIELPAESFVRLLYGRLDAAHTPDAVQSEHLESLRLVFPGL
jgi:uncharacterized protein (TIGR03083 family)